MDPAIPLRHSRLVCELALAEAEASGAARIKAARLRLLAATAELVLANERVVKGSHGELTR
jgi:hypothetical protein